jgi:CubicO group peptidase (beta-lactamase class C family)
MVRKSVRLFVAVTAAALSAGLVSAQQPQTDTPATRQLARWLESFNAANRDARQRFVAEHWPSRPNQNVDQDLAFREQTGGFDLIRIEESTPTRTVALAAERDSDTVARLTIEVEADTPHRIMRFGAQAIPRPPDLAIPRVTEADLVKVLRADLEKRVKADRFAGAVLVAKNNKPIFTGAYGPSNREQKIENRLDTRFRNGSMNKMFTATATLTLVQAGRVALDDPIAKHLPDYPNKTLASSVTIHHLLTHTGGTGDIFGPQFTARRLELKTHRDYLSLYGERDLLFAPGTKWMYSNYGFVLLGAIIERISGQSYYDYVRDHVYGPAGMTSTGSEPEDQLVQRLYATAGCRRLATQY